MPYDLTSIYLSLKLAFVTTVILIVIGIPLSWWLAHTPSKIKNLVTVGINLPLVLPPTVIGFYLLVFFSPQYFLGSFLENYFHVRIVFTFVGLVIGSVVFSLPFMVNPIKSGFENFPKSLMEASFALGKSKWQTLWHVILPNIRPSLWAGIIMSFAHTLGEFGVVLMIGGSIPGETRVASVAIYSEVEALNYSTAHVYSFILIAVAVTALLIMNAIKSSKASFQVLNYD